MNTYEKFKILSTWEIKLLISTDCIKRRVNLSSLHKEYHAWKCSLILPVSMFEQFDVFLKQEEIATP